MAIGPIFPQCRYAASQLFTGATLMEQYSAILLNCVEPYGRLKRKGKHVWLDHCDPSAKRQYHEIKIGTATSSLQLGKGSRLSIQMGPNISHFTPTQNTSIYRNVTSMQLANLLIENESATSINQETYLYQLRQEVRSKFHCLSTYTQYRSFSSIARNIAFHPYTSWTLHEYDSPQKINSQTKMLSSIFRTTACSVIRNGPSARVDVSCFKNLKDQLKDNVTKSSLA